MQLYEKKCKPCEGGVPALSLEEATILMEQTPDWSLGEDFKSISRDFSFRDFKQAIEFINKVADIAEEENHHPDLNLHGYKKLTINLRTHAINGLSENDFILAAKIDKLKG